VALHHVSAVHLYYYTVVITRSATPLVVEGLGPVWPTTTPHWHPRLAFTIIYKQTAYRQYVCVYIYCGRLTSVVSVAGYSVGPKTRIRSIITTCVPPAGGTYDRSKLAGDLFLVGSLLWRMTVSSSYVPEGPCRNGFLDWLELCARRSSPIKSGGPGFVNYVENA